MDKAIYKLLIPIAFGRVVGGEAGHIKRAIWIEDSHWVVALVVPWRLMIRTLVLCQFFIHLILQDLHQFQHLFLIPKFLIFLNH